MKQTNKQTNKQI